MTNPDPFRYFKMSSEIVRQAVMTYVRFPISRRNEIEQLALALDEVFMKINGERHYLWWAVDHEGDVLESFATKTRDKKAVLNLLKRAMRKHVSPDVIVTDKLRSCGAAQKKLGRHISRRLVAG